MIPLLWPKVASRNLGSTILTILVQVLDPLPDGMGEWVTLYAPKWDYLWVETYRPIDTPVDFKFWYRLHEYGNELQDLPFENGWYTTANFTIDRGSLLLALGKLEHHVI